MKPRIRAMRLVSDDGEEAENQFEDITLAEQARRSLRRDIILGLLEPDQTLKLEFLKERYGISFSPIREALTSLESERLVISVPSKGFKVAPLSEPEMWDAIDTRTLIDCEALRRSIKTGDDDWEAQLVSSFHAMKLAVKAMNADSRSPETEETLELRHQDFHRRLLSACGSGWLKQLSSQLYTQTERYRRPNLRAANSPYKPAASGERDVNKEHADLLDAVLERDEARACEILTSHYRETGQMIANAIKARAAAEKPVKRARK
jgi:GntR family carbon starvation induced transcriptional regulator